MRKNLGILKALEGQFTLIKKLKKLRYLKNRFSMLKTQWGLDARKINKILGKNHKNLNFRK